MEIKNRFLRFIIDELPKMVCPFIILFKLFDND